MAACDCSETGVRAAKQVPQQLSPQQAKHLEETTSDAYVHHIRMKCIFFFCEKCIPKWRWSEECWHIWCSNELISLHSQTYSNMHSLTSSNLHGFRTRKSHKVLLKFQPKNSQDNTTKSRWFENLEIPQYKSDVWERCILNFDSAHGTTPCPTQLAWTLL